MKIIIVVDIQRKWRTLLSKKIFFKMMIRNLWKEKFSQFFMELKFSKNQNENKVFKNEITLSRRFHIFYCYNN